MLTFSTYTDVAEVMVMMAGCFGISPLWNIDERSKFKFRPVRNKKPAISSTGGGEAGTYKYDFNINPFAHMNMPNIFLSNLSKNNLIEQQKNYSGNIPSAEPYKFEYTYDADGYPVELVKHFKNYRTGEHLFKIKIVYTYM